MQKFSSIHIQQGKGLTHCYKTVKGWEYWFCLNLFSINFCFPLSFISCFSFLCSYILSFFFIPSVFRTCRLSLFHFVLFDTYSIWMTHIGFECHIAFAACTYSLFPLFTEAANNSNETLEYTIKHSHFAYKPLLCRTRYASNTLINIHVTSTVC